MIIRPVSDLHIEFAWYDIVDLPEDKDSVLVLAGDIGLFKDANLVLFFESLAPRFRKIVYVAGNHEMYKSTFVEGRDRFKEKIRHLDNVHLLERETLQVDDVMFVGVTKWTLFRNGNPMAMLESEGTMNDYNYIRYDRNTYRKLRALDVLADSRRAHEWLQATLPNISGVRKTVVVTHHGPSYQSVPEQYASDTLNAAYVDDMDYWIAENGPHLWFHGHTHFSFDYTIENTRVICNPKGYPTAIANYERPLPGMPEWENETFNQTLQIEV